jgi:type I restriction enzyme S subunit
VTQDLASLIGDNLEVWTGALGRARSGRGGGARVEVHGVERLRALILNLAMKGKLVRQDPRDEPASELLRRVGRDRSAKNSVRASRSKQTPPGRDLPTGWVSVRFDELANPQAGFAFKSKNFNENGEGLPLIRIRDVGQPFSGTYYSGPYREEFLVERGDYLVSMDGEFRVAPWQGEPALLNQRVTRLQFYSEEVLARFIAIELQVELSKLQGVKAYTTVDHLSGKQIAATTIALPPLAEQHRIVARVNELMLLCNALEEESLASLKAHDVVVRTLLDRLTAGAGSAELATSWDRLEAHFETLFTTEASIDACRSAVLDLAVSGKLVPQRREDGSADTLVRASAAARDTRVAAGEFRAPVELPPADAGEALPLNWCAARLGDLVRVINGRAYKKQELLSEGTPVLRVGNLFTSSNWYYSDLELEADKYIDDGDLLYAWSASFGPFIWNGGRAIYHYHIWKLEPFDEASVSREFLRLFLESATAAIKASGHGIAMLHMTKERMEKLPLRLPPLEEQLRIVAKVKELNALCETLRLRIAEAAATQRDLADAIVEKAAA